MNADAEARGHRLLDGLVARRLDRDLRRMRARRSVSSITSRVSEPCSRAMKPCFATSASGTRLRARPDGPGPRSSPSGAGEGHHVEVAALGRLAHDREVHLVAVEAAQQLLAVAHRERDLHAAVARAEGGEQRGKK
jgi:hypothetical protein